MPPLFSRRSLEVVNASSSSVQEEKLFDPYKDHPSPDSPEPTDVAPVLRRTDNTHTVTAREVSSADGVNDHLIPQRLPGPQAGHGLGITRSTSSHRVHFWVVLPALISALLAAGAASALLAWLLSRRLFGDNPGFDTALVAAEGGKGLGGVSGFQLIEQMFEGDESGGPESDTTVTMYGLVISTLASKIVSFTIPLVLSVFAYLLADVWIRAQINRNKSSLPTPMQYGHIVSLCSTASIVSLFDTAKHLVSERKKRTATPSMLILAFMAVLTSLVLSSFISLADVWLHAVATTFTYEFSVPIPNATLPVMGSQINKTVCPGPVPFIASQPEGPFTNCQHVPTTLGDLTVNWGDASLIGEGVAVHRNYSLKSQIQQIEDDLFTILPKDLPTSSRNITFTSFAMTTRCRPVGDCQIALNGIGDLTCPSFSPPFLIQLDTSLRNSSHAMSMLNQFNISTNATIYETAIKGIEVEAPAGYRLDSSLNRAGVHVVLYYDQDRRQFSSSIANGVADNLKVNGTYISKFPVGTDLFVYYIGSCELDMYQVALSYTSLPNAHGPQINLISPPTLITDFNTSSALLAGLDSGHSRNLASDIADTLFSDLESSLEFSDLVAGNVSKGLLAYAAPLIEHTLATDGFQITSSRVSRYPLAPLCAVLALTYGYALVSLAIAIAVWMLSSKDIITQDASGSTVRREQEIGLVHFRLTSPRACIVDRFDTAEMSDMSRESVFKQELMREKKHQRLGTGFVWDMQWDEFSDSRVVQRKVGRFKVDTVDALKERTEHEYSPQ
ncbi:hypothetical protein D9758_009741 [Tetrapyrgos nigripes]|uniref:Uncharacterized protein n=1 Tax=Tetrapyrgos nigripes TaxID=182062 RepID=A0A8H5LR85_9AGAR|nr:hypothetical protein D9758_009741 [Tetrapyrgos nigripes]